MKIHFSWKRDGDRDCPVSKSDSLNDNGVSLLDCVLMDDGGLSYSATMAMAERVYQEDSVCRVGRTEVIRLGAKIVGSCEYCGSKASDLNEISVSENLGRVLVDKEGDSTCFDILWLQTRGFSCLYC